MNIRPLANIVICAAITCFGFGCASVEKGTPIAPVLMNANMDSKDYAVLDKTEGTSTTESYLGPLLQIVDGKKVSILGIKFYEDQYAFQNSKRSEMWPMTIFNGPSTEERAYYKALAATPDADAVTGKAFDKSTLDFLIYKREKATYRGKALKYHQHP